MGTPERSPGARTARLSFLVLEDEATLLREIGRVLSLYGDAVLVETLADAHLALDTVHRWAGAVIDILLRPGSGLEVVERLGIEHPALPVLVITGDLVPERINRACRSGVSFLAKPFTKDDIQRFARSASDTAEGRLRSALVGFAKRYHFCASETEVLAYGLECRDQRAIAALRGCSVYTVQSHIASMMKKTGARSFHWIVLDVVREAAGVNACV